MKLKTALLSASLALFTFNLSADTVDNAEIIDFQAGAPACAADVNQTIQALITAVNDNAARIAELEYISPLSLADELSDSKFQIVSFESGIGSTFSNYDGRVTQALFGEIATWILHADGTLTSTFAYTERETGVEVGHIEGQVTVAVLPEVNDSATFSDNGTWSLNGQILTVSLDGDTDDYFISADGNMLLSGGPDSRVSGGVTLSMVDIVVGMRILEPNIVVTLSGGDPSTEAIPSGQVLTTGSIGGTYTIHNTGNRALTISNISGSDNLVITSPLSSNTIQKGESADFTITFDSAGNKEFTIHSNDPDTPSFTRTAI